MAKCKNTVDKCTRQGTEASGYCFECAEELACLIASANEEFAEFGHIDPASAYGKTTPKPAPKEPTPKFSREAKAAVLNWVHENEPARLERSAYEVFPMGKSYAASSVGQVLKELEGDGRVRFIARAGWVVNYEVDQDKAIQVVNDYRLGKGHVVRAFNPKAVR